MNQDRDIEVKVSFGRRGRTLVYEDPEGEISFTFDCSPAAKESGKQWNLHLSRTALIDVGGTLAPTEGKTEIERQRIKTALGRVENYALSCGYIVLLE